MKKTLSPKNKEEKESFDDALNSSQYPIDFILSPETEEIMIGNSLYFIYI